MKENILCFDQYDEVYIHKFIKFKEFLINCELYKLEDIKKIKFIEKRIHIIMKNEVKAEIAGSKNVLDEVYQYLNEIFIKNKKDCILITPNEARSITLSKVKKYNKENFIKKIKEFNNKIHQNKSGKTKIYIEVQQNDEEEKEFLNFLKDNGYEVIIDNVVNNNIIYLISF